MKPWSLVEYGTRLESRKLNRKGNDQLLRVGRKKYPLWLNIDETVSRLDTGFRRYDGVVDLF